MTIRITSSLSIPEHEVTFRFARSSGPGGQNVNKVATRVELVFNVRDSASLTNAQKEQVYSRLGSRIDSGGNLHFASQESRSQWRNREVVVEKFASLMQKALAVQKKRKPTRPSAASQHSRIRSKKSHSVKKKLRGKVNAAGE
ncbi:MAG: aminoacyl-tRNA hydrolase [Bacteroidetes bacterium]|nr:aminoacyl-tRNA hydrolase [Bacteroidota bacterium]MCW5897413.1 aminoacyl-tRNA hydrolase [Bacteroidota bacterium]